MSAFFHNNFLLNCNIGWKNIQHILHLCTTAYLQIWAWGDIAEVSPLANYLIKACDRETLWKTSEKRKKRQPTENQRNNTTEI